MQILFSDGGSFSHPHAFAGPQFRLKLPHLKLADALVCSLPPLQEVINRGGVGHQPSILTIQHQIQACMRIPIILDTATQE